MSVTSDEFQGTVRFQPVGVLGRGGMGVVYRVWDTELGGEVALKTVPNLSAEEIYWLKHEFRVLAGISHPNLVMLHELTLSGRQCFFTMELVDGIDFLRYVRGDDPAGGNDHAPVQVDVARLSAVLRQLARGLGALHTRDIIHHDVKPTNVLVERTGRVVLLDFGLAVARVAQKAVAGDGTFAGTPAYMAPELLAGAAPSPATDWYSVGAMVYEALTGNIPYGNSAGDIQFERARASPPWPPEVALFVPVPLQALVSRLLDPEPQRRPSATEVLAALDNLAAESGARAMFVGRSPEMALLRANLERARAGRPSLVHVLGPSGIGKTELIARFLDLVEADEALVLRGRCLTQESVPYKAFDAAVDALSGLLARRPPETLARVLPSAIGALARLFPVLEQFIQHATAERDEVPDPQERRRQGFAAFRELLARLADEKPLVVWIDDLQWSDLDSVALLSELVQDAELRTVSLILSYRSEEMGRMPWLDKLEADAVPTLSVQTLPLGPLAPADAETLARSLCPPALSSSARIKAIVEESDGSPFFIGELARSADPHDGADFAAGGVRLEDAVVRRAGQLTRPARELLEIVCLAGLTVKRRIVLAALGVGERGRPLVTVLEHEHFLRVTSLDDEPALQVYHDRIREAVVEQLGAERQRHWHQRLAEALRQSPRPDPERLFEHYRGAGDNGVAGAYAAEAAERASRTLAFDRAAELWAEALRLQPDVPERWRLLTQLAEALANAGRRRAAAEAFEAAAVEIAARSPGDPIRFTLQRRAAEHYLRSGLIEQGLALTRSMLAELGIRLPATARAASLAALWQWAQLLWRGIGFTLRDEPAPPEALQRLDVCWGTITSLTVVDPGLSEPLAIRHLLEALELGDRSRLIQALGYEACREAAVGGRFFRKRSRRLLAAADGLLDGSAANYDRALHGISRGTTEYCEGHWRVAVETFDAAAAMFRERCTGVSWEIGTCDIFAATALARMGRFRALAERLPTKIAEADARSDVHTGASLRLGLPNLLWLAHDQPEGARRESLEAMAGIPGNLFPVLHVLHVLGETHVDLYTGDALRAWQRVHDGWRIARRSRLLFLELFKLDWRFLRARVAIALASGPSPEGRARERNGWSRAQLLRRAETDAAFLAGCTFACGAPRAAAIRAALAQLRGHPDQATVLLRLAETGFARADMAAHAAAAARASAVLRGGKGCEEAEALLRAEGVRVPAVFAGVLVPGPWARQ